MKKRIFLLLISINYQLCLPIEPKIQHVGVFTGLIITFAAIKGIIRNNDSIGNNVLQQVKVMADDSEKSCPEIRTITDKKLKVEIEPLISLTKNGLYEMINKEKINQAAFFNNKLFLTLLTAAGLVLTKYSYDRC